MPFLTNCSWVVDRLQENAAFVRAAIESGSTGAGITFPVTSEAKHGCVVVIEKKTAGTGKRIKTLTKYHVRRIHFL